MSEGLLNESLFGQNSRDAIGAFVAERRIQQSELLYRSELFQ
jgi:hypothetical protein